MNPIKSFVVYFLITAAILVPFALLAYGAGSVTCKSRWAMSGLATSYGPLQRCQVKTPKGRWMPEDRVRESDLSEPVVSSQAGAIPK